MTDWGTLSHAYGDAGDVPAMLTALRSGDAEQASHDLWASVLHQGTLYSASAPAVAEICKVLRNRSAARVRTAAWLAGQAVEAALAYPPDDEHARAVRAAAEPLWDWAKGAIDTSRYADTAAEVLAVHTDRVPAALELLTTAVERWPGRPALLSAIHALDPHSPVLARAVDDPDPRLAATAAILLIDALGGPPDDALGERLIAAVGRVLSHEALTTDLPDTPVKLIMTALTGIDPEFTEPEYPHAPTGSAARLVGTLLDSAHEPTATETYVALIDRNLVRSRAVAGWATDLVADRIDRVTGPTADAALLAAFALGPRMAEVADRVAAVDWAPGSMAGGAAAALLSRLSPARADEVPGWLERDWGHPDLARLAQPTEQVVAAAVARLRRLGPPVDSMTDFSTPWHARALDGYRNFLHNNEFFAWQEMLVHGGRTANEHLARLRADWPADTLGLSPTLRAEHLTALGDEAGARGWLIERVSRGNDHRLDVDWLWERPADPEVVAAARKALSELDVTGYVSTEAITLAGWVAVNSDWDPTPLFTARAHDPWSALTMLDLRRRDNAFEDLVAAAVPTVIPLLHKRGQCLAAAKVLRPTELTDTDATERARILVRLATRLPEHSEEAIALLAEDPTTLALATPDLHTWLTGDETFAALPISTSAGFTDAHISAQLTHLLNGSRLR